MNEIKQTVRYAKYDTLKQLKNLSYSNGDSFVKCQTIAKTNTTIR